MSDNTQVKSCRAAMELISTAQEFILCVEWAMQTVCDRVTVSVLLTATTAATEKLDAARMLLDRGDGG